MDTSLGVRGSSNGKVLAYDGWLFIDGDNNNYVVNAPSFVWDNASGPFGRPQPGMLVYGSDNLFIGQLNGQYASNPSFYSYQAVVGYVVHRTRGTGPHKDRGVSRQPLTT